MAAQGGEYKEDLEELYENIRSIGETILDIPYEEKDPVENILNISGHIAFYLGKDISGDERLIFARVAFKEEKEQLNGDKYSERALNHLEILYYTISEYLDGERDSVMRFPVNIQKNRHKRYEELAELTSDLDERINRWTLA